MLLAACGAAAIFDAAVFAAFAMLFTAEGLMLMPFRQYARPCRRLISLMMSLTCRRHDDAATALRAAYCRARCCYARRFMLPLRLMLRRNNVIEINNPEYR